MIKDPQLIPKIPISLMVPILQVRRFVGNLPFKEIEECVEEWKQAKEIFPLDKDVQIKSIDIDGLEAAWVRIQGIEPRGTIFYCHGGGYAFGSIEMHKEFVSRLARTCNMEGFIFNYRLTPEHPFPAGLEDSLKAYTYILDQGKDPDTIVIAGDSAGGGLTMSTLLKLRELQLPLPKCTVCISPWVDLTHTSESNRLNVKIDPMLRPNVLKKIAKFYSPTEDFTNPLISPVFADLTGLPPMLILVGTLEVLLDDARLLAKNAERDGVATELEIWEGMPHVFPYMAAVLPEAEKSIENIGTFVRQYIV
ncbi:MAG TPA: alpha/beta hydrolase [Planctomycetota bacterium]|nr:alpha/beta hydrolase [Planctomycetota bacterium]HRU51152.1 alpha/beta hydrolase [Planctomycetota bacterium]